VGGQVALDEHGHLVGKGDMRAQMRQVGENLKAALAAAGATLAQVVKLTVYLTDLADLAVFREVRDEFLDGGPPPASTLVQVAGLINPEFRVEVEALAVLAAWLD
jgi:enamine deaminase RidA (YjgF/YER057c/UK114 family)